MHNAAEFLASNLAKLNEKDRRFVESLLADDKRRGATPKQAYWIDTLAKRAAGEDAVKIHLNRIADMFRHAISHGIKFPKIRLTMANDMGRLSVEYSAAKNIIYINDKDRKRWSEQRGRDVKKGYGFIALADKNTFVFSKYVDRDLLPHVVATLKAFENDPHKISALEGHATGNCCFCGIKLTTAASVAVGYGPICAEHYGLPHGGGSNANNVHEAMQNWRDNPANAEYVAEEKEAIEGMTRNGSLKECWRIEYELMSGKTGVHYVMSEDEARCTFDTMPTSGFVSALLIDPEGKCRDSWGT